MAKTVETEKFEMHENLLFDVIRRQSGTLEKAVLEAVMNAADAKATRCDIALDKDMLIVTDNGDGFPDIDYIRKFFKVFGQPHEEAEEKIYANFRMGRGQLFAYGVNEWRSGEFAIDVDVKHKGLNFDIHSGLGFEEGCEVTVYFYQPLLPSRIDHVMREIGHFCKWMSMETYLNDELISTHPDEAKWDYESDSCYVKLRAHGELNVYNLGAFTKKFSTFEYGRGGDIVSKQQLRLNFARNDIMVNECPIWKEVTAFVKTQANKEVKKKKTPLNDDERRMISLRIRAGELDDVQFKQKIITDVNNRNWSVHELRNAKFAKRFTSSRRWDRRAGKIHDTKRVFIISNSTLERFEVSTTEELLTYLIVVEKHRYGASYLKTWKHIELAPLMAKISNSYAILKDGELTMHEQIWLELIKKHQTDLTWYDGRRHNIREIYIGEAEHADGWTDGSSYIAISRSWLKHQSYHYVTGPVAVGALLIHEYCHDEEDTGSHAHSPEFYEKYHEHSMDYVGHFASNVYFRSLSVVKKYEKKLDKGFLRCQDFTANIPTRAKTRAKRLEDIVTKLEDAKHYFEMAMLECGDEFTKDSIDAS